MTLIKKKILFFLSLILLNFISTTKTEANDEIKIVAKINNEIITNIDISYEYNYLIALNNNLKNISLNEGLLIAKDSLIREKIKINELKRYFILENIDKKITDEVLVNFYQNLNLANEKDFSLYLNNYNLSLDNVREKIKIEILWNQLISRKFKDQININEETLKNEIEEKNLDLTKSIEFDLSEIVFQASNEIEFAEKIKQIKLSIENNGFNTSANKYSVSKTANFGGKIGKVEKNQLSDKIQKELEKIQIGQYTNPINIAGGFLIIFINDKIEITKKLSKEEILKNLIKFEKRKQLEQFSQIYFNKIKINTQINET